MVSHKPLVFSDEDVRRISDTYHAWRIVFESDAGAKPAYPEGRQSPYTDIDGFRKSATLAEVQKQDYKLIPGIYVGT